MGKKAIIFDLDNTIYSVHSIGDELFATLFEMIRQDGHHSENMEEIKDDIMRRPFQMVARDFQFSRELTENGMVLLNELTYEGKIEPFKDYQFVKNLAIDKFLVTTGFPKLQQSKVTGMKIEQDFKEIHIVDPSTSDKTKLDVFADIMKRHGYAREELLVVGDDLHSEIKTAQDLGIDAVLYDNFNRHNNIATPSDHSASLPVISDFKQLSQFL